MKLLLLQKIIYAKIDFCGLDIIKKPTFNKGLAFAYYKLRTNSSSLI